MLDPTVFVANPDDLTLFHYPGCAFCRRVVLTLRELDVEIATRDIHRDEGAREELLAACGRTTVPVLRILEADGAERWLPESADIVRYLRDTFA